MDDASRGLLNGRVVLSPMLSVRGGSQAIEFYKTAFGATELFRTGDGGTSIVSRLAIGKAEFWVADESPAHGNFSPASLNGSTVRIVMIVDDPDGMAAQAVSAGATVVYPVEDQPYGWRTGRVMDPFGHHWEIGKPIDDISGQAFCAAELCLGNEGLVGIKLKRKPLRAHRHDLTGNNCQASS